MTIRRFLAFSAAAILLPLAGPAVAQSALRVGATVTDPQGGTVGTISAIDATTLMLHTDRHDVRLPLSSFTATDSAVLFGMTQAQLNAAVEQAEAQAAQAFAIGTILRDSAGTVVGPVTALDAETVTVQIDANVVRVPRTALAAGQGGLVIGATRAQLQAASVPAPPAQPAPAPAQ
jgi:preprotein translocase subunit YajC